jgi:glycosyltransferase involved in cell wall biosynthesis
VDRNSAAFRISARLEAFCYRQAWLITGQSKTIIADIARRYPQLRTFHLSNGVDSERFGPNRFNQEARAELSNNGDFVAVYAGLHGLAQGLDQVLEVARILKTQDAFRFVFVGDGPQKRMLQERARDLVNVRFFDPRPASEMPALVAAADAILVTLKGQIPGAVPSKLYEAMASGCPVVLAAEGEAAEIVKQYEAGIVVKPGDANALADALRRLRSDPDLCLQMGMNGREAVRLHFDRSLIASNFINHLEDSLN